MALRRRPMPLEDVPHLEDELLQIFQDIEAEDDTLELLLHFMHELEESVVIFYC